MDFGLFYYCQGRGVPHDQAYAEMLDQIALAETLGFGECWFAEHHFTDYSLLPRRGARVLCVGRSGRRFALARELGAEAVHTLSDGSLERAGQGFSGREGVDCVIETAGTPEAVNHALELVRPGGRVVLTGLPHAPTPVGFFSVVRREVTITGSMIYQDEFAEAMRLVATGQVRTAPLITHRFALEEIGRAFAVHQEPTAIKVAVVP